MITKSPLPILIALLICSCDKKNPDYPSTSQNHLKVINQSSRTINFIIYWNYPDSSIEEYNPLRNGTDGILPGESFTRGIGRDNCWEAQLKEHNYEWIYFFDRDSLKTIPWDTVRATERGLLERRKIDLAYLMANDYTVIYQ